MISYSKLFHILADRRLSLPSVVRESGLSETVTKRIRNDQSVEIKSLEKICLYLGVDIGDVCEITSDK